MKTRELLILFFLTVTCIGCTRLVNDKSEDESDKSDEAINVSIVPILELTNVADFTPDSISSKDSLLYAVQVYEEGKPLCYGLFSDYKKMQVRLTDTKRYSFKVAAFLKGSGAGLKTESDRGLTYYSMPDTISLRNTFLKGDDLIGLDRINNIQLAAEKKRSEFPELDVFYQETEVTASSTLKTLNVYLKRTSFALSVAMSGLTTGQLELYFDGDTIPLTTTLKNYLTIRSFIGGRLGLFEVARIDTFSTTKKIGLKWKGLQGMVVTAEKTVQLVRNNRISLELQMQATETGYTIKDWDNVLSESNNPEVTTLCGKTNETGKSIDGSLAVAQFNAPIWLAMDKINSVYVLEDYLGTRHISITENQVSTPYRTSQSVQHPRTIDFSLSGDSILLSNEQWSKDGVGCLFMTRNNGFNNPLNLFNAVTTNSVVVNPADGEIFFNNYKEGKLYRWNKPTNQPVEIIQIDDASMDVSMCFSRDGKVLYFISKNRHYILKANYDLTTKKISAIEVFAGAKNNSGVENGLGAKARFSQPCQGQCDKDGNLFVADRGNHCIRKISPSGLVSTWAGTMGQDGYLDHADPLKAKFKNPEGLTIDNEGVVYVADTKNNCIRRIGKKKSTN